MSAAQKAAI